MANKETSGFNQSKTPVTDPTHIFTSVSGATDSATPSTLTYTTATAHKFVIGQSVIIYGFANNAYNFAPDTIIYGTATGLGAGRPAVITAIGSTTTFSVKATAQVTTTATGGYVFNDADASNSPWDTAWLPTQTAADAASNYQVGLEWGDSFPIQPNDGRATALGATSKTTASISGVTANGSTIVYNVNADATGSISTGSWITIDGVIPAQFNFNSIQVAAVTSTQVTVLSTATGAYDSANSFGQIAPITVVGPDIATAAVGARSYTGVTATTNTNAYVYSVSSHGYSVGQTVTISGMLPNSFNQTGVITTTAAGTFTLGGTVATGTGSTRVGNVSSQSVYFTANVPHGLTNGQSITVSANGAYANVADFNITGSVNSTTTTKFGIPAPKAIVGGSTPVSVTGTNVTYTTLSGHNLTSSSDAVSVYGFIGGANLNTLGDTTLSVAPTTNAFTIQTPTSITATSGDTITAVSGVVTYTVVNTGTKIKTGHVVTVSGVTGVGTTGVFNVNSVVIAATAGAIVLSGGASAIATTSITLTNAVLNVVATTAATPISGVSNVATSGQSITLTVPNTFVVGQTVTLAGLQGGTNYNTSGTITAADPSAITVTYPANVSLGSTAPTQTSAGNSVTISAGAVSANGYAVKKSGTFNSTAVVTTIGGADNAWGPSYLVPTIALNPNTDNAEIVTTARVGYPDFLPTFSVPNVVGKTYTNAIQALKAAGVDGVVGIPTVPTGVTAASASAGASSITATGTVSSVLGMTVSGTGIAPGTTVTKVASQVLSLSLPLSGSVADATALSFSAPPTYLAVTGATVSGSVVTYTVASTSTLNVGDVVTIANIFDSVNTTGAANTQYNRNLVQIATIPSTTTFTVNMTGVSGTYSASGTVTPYSTVVTAQSTSGTNVLTEGTNSKVVTLTRYAGL